MKFLSARPDFVRTTYRALTKDCPFRQWVGSAAVFSALGHSKTFISPKPIRLPLAKRYFLQNHPFENSPDSIVANFYGHKERAKNLVVILPGIFFALDHALAQFICSKVHNDGHDVVCFPSPFTDDFLTRHPFYSPGSFDFEADAFGQSLQGLMKKYDKIHLMGASYGSFLSSQLYVKSQEFETPFNGKLILVSPVIKMRQTLDLIDHLIKMRQSDHKLYKKPSAYLVAGEFLEESVRFQQRIVETYLEQKKHGFEKQYVDSRENHWQDFSKYVESIKDRVYDKKFRENLTLNHALKYLTPENRFYSKDNIDETRLWLDQIPIEKVRLFTAINDPIIPFESYDSTVGYNKEYLSQPVFNTYDFGAHGAFVVFPDVFQKIVASLRE